MNVAKAIFLGLVQGLTEFLPVSSSGHLVLLQRILGVKGDMLLFDIVLHLGTLLAVLIIFRKDIWECIKHPLSPMSVSLVIATIPAIVIALFFGDFIEKTFSGAYLGFGFLITAGLLFFTHYKFNESDGAAPKSRFRRATVGVLTAGSVLRVHDQGKMTSVARINRDFGAALVIGLFQGVALLPGISRSGATVSGGIVCGMGREKAARFSFLLSVPIILAGAVYKIAGASAVTESLGLLSAITGFIAAAFAGFIAIKFMLDMIKKSKLWYFGVYLLILGAFVLLNQYVLTWF